MANMFKYDNGLEEVCLQKQLKKQFKTDKFEW